jgi:hypothetical protein
VLVQTHQTASSNTSAWKAPLHVRSWISPCESCMIVRTNTRSRNSSRYVA